MRSPDSRTASAFSSSSRVLLGLSAGVFTPTANAVAVAMVPPAMRGRAIATVIGGMTVAVAFGAPIGTLPRHARVLADAVLHRRRGVGAGCDRPSRRPATGSARGAPPRLASDSRSLPSGRCSGAPRHLLLVDVGVRRVHIRRADPPERGYRRGRHQPRVPRLRRHFRAGQRPWRGGCRPDRRGADAGDRTLHACRSACRPLGAGDHAPRFHCRLRGGRRNRGLGPRRLVVLSGPVGAAGRDRAGRAGGCAVAQLVLLFFGQAAGAGLASLAVAVVAPVELGFIGAACAVAALIVLRWSAGRQTMPLGAPAE